MRSGLNDHVQQDLSQRGVRRLTAVLKPPGWLRVQAQLVDSRRGEPALVGVLLEKLLVSLELGRRPAFVSLGKIRALASHDSAKPHALDVQGQVPDETRGVQPEGT